MCDVAVELLKGGLRRWASYEDRKPLGAFVNTLLGNRLGDGCGRNVPNIVAA